MMFLLLQLQRKIGLYFYIFTLFFNRVDCLLLCCNDRDDRDLDDRYEVLNRPRSLFPFHEPDDIIVPNRRDAPLPSQIPSNTVGKEGSSKDLYIVPSTPPDDPKQEV